MPSPLIARQLFSQVPRIALEASTFDGLLAYPAVPARTVFLVGIAKAAGKTGNLFYTFGMGDANRSCAFKPFFEAFMGDPAAGAAGGQQADLAPPLGPFLRHLFVPCVLPWPSRARSSKEGCGLSRPPCARSSFSTLNRMGFSLPRESWTVQQVGHYPCTPGAAVCFSGARIRPIPQVEVLKNGSYYLATATSCCHCTRQCLPPLRAERSWPACNVRRGACRFLAVCVYQNFVCGHGSELAVCVDGACAVMSSERTASVLTPRLTFRYVVSSARPWCCTCL